ncbi:hypothetical protein F4802DRAFT_579679 [Xylaria palmicola]|nr:hypothetical protein F4802DRAFT_579679 [Xylaria palmicola]
MTDSLMMHAVRQAPPMGPPPSVALSANPLAAIVAITVIMVAVVAAKLWVRAIIIKKLALDDWSVLVGSLFVIANTGIIGSIFVQAGLNSGSALASPGQIQDPKFAPRLFVFLLISAIPNGFAKLSILLLLLAIFPRRARPMTAYVIYVGIGIVLFFYTILTLYIAIHCGPRTCSVEEQVKIAQATASVNLSLDVYVLTLAIVNVWTLQMSRRYKIGVMAVFSTGILALVASIIVLYYRVTTTQNPDAVWVQVLTPLVLVIYEPAIGLITASLPTAPSLWVVLSKTSAVASMRHLLSQMTRGSGSSGGGYELGSNAPTSDSQSKLASRTRSTDTDAGAAAKASFGDQRGTKTYVADLESARRPSRPQTPRY